VAFPGSTSRERSGRRQDKADQESFRNPLSPQLGLTAIKPGYRMESSPEINIYNRAGVQLGDSFLDLLTESPTCRRRKVESDVLS
jgi:hypothetical protein